MLPTYLWLAILWYNMLIYGNMLPSRRDSAHKIHPTIFWNKKSLDFVPVCRLPMQWTLQPSIMKNWKTYESECMIPNYKQLFCNNITIQNISNLESSLPKAMIFFNTWIQMSCTSQSACKHKLIKCLMDPRSWGDLIVRTRTYPNLSTWTWRHSIHTISFTKHGVIYSCNSYIRISYKFQQVQVIRKCIL